MRRLAILWLVSCAGVLSGSFPLSPMGCDLSEPETGTVAAIIDGETLTLADGRTVPLIGAKAPVPPLGFRGEDPRPWSRSKRLRRRRPVLPKGKRSSCATAARELMRSRTSSWWMARAGSGCSRRWSGQGSPRVYSFPDNRACVIELLASESDAWAKGLGVWGSAVRIARPMMSIVSGG
jgi:micrococcal nuclease